MSTHTVRHDYVTQNGKVVRETITTDGTVTTVMDFIYDTSGRPFALIYTNGTAEPVTYYYLLNIQGDVVALINASGAYVAQYTYDAWGNTLTSSGEMAEINPLRYRGYYYDTETGFYYLQSRYYDPANHRFINADVTTNTGIDFAGTNMFAYCNNNPVSYMDPEGQFLKKVIKWFTEVVLKPATEWAEETLSDYNGTFTFGPSTGITTGIFGFNVQSGVSVDTQGNVALQGSFSGDSLK